MAVQVIWLIFSYALLFSIPLLLLDSGNALAAYGLLVLIPVVRISMRFRRSGGYRMIGVAGQVSGNIGERGGFASRSSNRVLFWSCFVVEVVTVLFLSSRVLFN